MHPPGFDPRPYMKDFSYYNCPTVSTEKWKSGGEGNNLMPPPQYKKWGAIHPSLPPLLLPLWY